MQINHINILGLILVGLSEGTYHEWIEILHFVSNQAK